MKLWLIRHAIAVEADAFAGSDLDRPLTPEGRRIAKAAFSRLASLRRGPACVISSEAVRARETADIFCLAFGIRNHHRTHLLNPGARFKFIKKAIADLPASISFAALVGHEPDFSHAISRWTSDGALQLDLKKCGLVEVELRAKKSALLTMILPPEILAGES